MLGSKLIHIGKGGPKDDYYQKKMESNLLTQWRIYASPT